MWLEQMVREYRQWKENAPNPKREDFERAFAKLKKWNKRYPISVYLSTNSTYTQLVEYLHLEYGIDVDNLRNSKKYFTKTKYKLQKFIDDRDITI